jgi:hypothetical protein
MILSALKTAIPLCFISMVFASVAYSCPDLTGTYTCTLTVGSADFTVKQETNAEDVTTYYFLNHYGMVKETVVADGKVQETRQVAPIGSPGDVWVDKKSHFCLADVLVETGTSQGLKSNGDLKWSFESRAEMRLDKNRDWQSAYTRLDKSDPPFIQTCIRKF